jgi:hypothetical protein
VPPSGGASCRYAQLVATRPDALQVNPRPVIATGIGLFFVAFLALLPFWSWLGSHHHRDWLWTALAGWLLGLAGWLLMGRHRRAGRTL